MDHTGSMLNLALGDGAWVLWLLVALSVISVVIMVERGLVFYRRRFRQGPFIAAPVVINSSGHAVLDQAAQETASWLKCLSVCPSR